VSVYGVRWVHRGRAVGGERRRGSGGGDVGGGGFIRPHRV